jgi:outer membrane immunogenic protein
MRNKLLSSVAGAAFILSASGLAFAADIAVKAPPPAPAPVYNWTGWYVGVNAGASFGRADTDFHSGPFRSTNAIGAFSDFSGPAFSDSGQPDGFMGGGQIGYNWQYSPLIVVGVEADFQGALEKDTATLTNTFSGNVTPSGPIATTFITGTTNTNYSTQIDWFGTVRARIGYVWGNGNVMSYLTGGLAYGEVKINGTHQVGATFDNIVPFSLTTAFGHSQNNTGWVVGYGTEAVIDFWGARNWTWKVEGLWMDLGTIDTTGTGAGSIVCPLCGPAANPFHETGSISTHTHFTDGILRGGLNYRFY